MNKRMGIRWWLGWLGLGLFGSLASGGTAIAGGIQDSPFSAQTQVEGWQLGVRPGGVLDKAGLLQLVQDLARVELDFKVHRDFDATEERLHELWLAASTGSISAPQWHFLIELAMARSRLYAEARRFELAGGHLDHLIFALPKTNPLARPVTELTAPSKALLLEEKKQLLDPRLVELRQEVAAKLSRAQQGGLGSGLDREDPYVKTVLALIENQQIQSVTQMGTTVLPILEEVALEGVDEFPENVSLDPLYWIQQLSVLRVPRVCLAGLERGGEVWRFRVIRYLETFGIPGLDDSAARRKESAVRWGAVIEKLVGDPRVGLAALPYAVEVYAAGYRSPLIEGELLNAWHSPDPERRQAVLNAFAELAEEGMGMDPVRPLLEQLLESGVVEDRHLAAKWLSRECLKMGSLREHARDTDPVIRENLAYALYRQVSRSNEVLGDENLDLLLTLAADEAFAVRRRVVSLLGESPRGPVPREAYLTLARDPDPGIRRAVAGLRLDLNSDLLPPLFEILAADTDSEVVARVDEWCAKFLRDNYTLNRRSEFVATITARLRNQVHPLRECIDALQRESIYRRFFRTSGGADPAKAGSVAAELARVALELDDVQLLKILTTEDPQQRRVYPALGMPRDLLLEVIARVVRKGDGIHSAEGVFGWLSKPEQLGDTSLTEVVWSLARNPEVDRRARVRALANLAYRGDPRCLAVTRELFRAADWREQRIDDVLSESLYQLGKALPRPDRDRLVPELIADPGTSPEPLDPFLSGAYGLATLDVELAQRILERFFDGTEGGVPAAHAMVDLALHAVVVAPTARDLERIVAALHQPSRTYGLVVRLGEVPDPRWMPLLAEALSCPWMSDDQTRLSCGRAAAQSLANHYSDEAARMLLDGMRRASSDKVRSACQQGLKRIRDFREEEERVFARQTAALNRDDAILDLLSLLEDPDPILQAEAARGLATLGAVDALPRLIRLLRTENESVKSAVREAIDRLNEAGAEEEAPEKGD